MFIEMDAESSLEAGGKAKSISVSQEKSPVQFSANARVSTEYS